MLKLYILSIIVFCTGLYLFNMKVDSNEELIELLKSKNIRRRKNIILFSQRYFHCLILF